MFDAIIVFGAGINSDGSLEENSRVRVERAVELWNKKIAPVIVMSGAWSMSLEKVPARTEAEAMVLYAQQLGCPSTCLLKEEKSKDTIGNAFFVKTLFAIPLKWKSMVVVAADYHVNRVRHICERVFGPDYTLQFEGAPLPMTSNERGEREIRERASQSLFDDLFTFKPGDHHALKDLLNGSHPAYSANSKYSFQDIRRMIADRETKLRLSRQT